MTLAITAKAVVLGTLMAVGASAAYADEETEAPACYDALSETGQSVFDMMSEMRTTAMEDGDVSDDERKAMQDAMRSEMRSKVMRGDLKRSDARATAEAVQACLQAEAS